MSTRWRGSTEGPRSMTVPSTWAAPVQAWPRPRGPAPLRARRARKASVHPCRGPLQPLAGDAQQAPAGRVWHRHLHGGIQPGHSEGRRMRRFCAQRTGLCREQGGVSSWGAPRIGSGKEAPAGPDGQRRGRDWPCASSSLGSFSVVASANSGISYTGMEIYIYI